MVAHFSIEKWHRFHFDVFFSNGSQGDFFDYKLVNIWLDKIKKRHFCRFLPQKRVMVVVKRKTGREGKGRRYWIQRSEEILKERRYETVSATNTLQQNACGSLLK